MKKFLVLVFILGAMSLNARIDVIRKCYEAGSHQIWLDAIDPEVDWVMGEKECTLVKATKTNLDNAQKLLKKSQKYFDTADTKNEIAFNIFKKQYAAATTDEERQQAEGRYRRIEIEMEAARNILNISRNRLGYYYLSIPGGRNCRFFPQGDKVDGIGYSACIKRGQLNMISSMSTCGNAGTSKSAIGYYLHPDNRKKCYIHRRLMSVSS